VAARLDARFGPDRADAAPAPAPVPAGG
jgi:hypothetical protein